MLLQSENVLYPFEIGFKIKMQPVEKGIKLHD